MKIEDIREMINQDTKINSGSLDTEATNIPQIHNKYLCLLMDEKLVLTKYESDLRILNKNKWLYYSGKMSQEQLKILSWEVFELALLRTDVDRFIESDTDIIVLQNKCVMQREKVSYIEQVVKLIANKIWNIRAALDWIKFTQGV